MAERRKLLQHYDLTLYPDPSRTILKPFSPGDVVGGSGGSRTERIIDRVRRMDDKAVHRAFKTLKASLAKRHRNVDAYFQAQFDALRKVIGDRPIEGERALLLGAYFVEEYSFEAAALFNPSIVLLTDQSDAPKGGVRFAMSLRGIGEGHISSVVFRTGSWVPGKAPRIDKPSRLAVSPLIDGDSDGDRDRDDTVVSLRWDGIENVSEAVLFPVLKRHRQGIEDARFVRFVEDDGTPRYYATVTAFSGSEIREELICVDDMTDFELHPLSGTAAGNKGMALFPRRVGGRYMMIGRQDNENLWLLRSDDLFVWNESEKLLGPEHPWEFIQMGNCGSPIEIDEGWLLLTHGVGPARTYSIGACLLDKDDPSKVLGRTPVPLLRPTNEERDGYVPNVVYSCGSLVHDRTLLLPYAVADSMTRFATASVDDILSTIT